MRKTIFVALLLLAPSRGHAQSSPQNIDAILLHNALIREALGEQTIEHESAQNAELQVKLDASVKAANDAKVAADAAVKKATDDLAAANARADAAVKELAALKGASPVPAQPAPAPK